MSETKSSSQAEKAPKIRRKPEQESVLTPTFAAARAVSGNECRPSQSAGSGLLQRQCGCGKHTIGGGLCEACQKKGESASGVAPVEMSETSSPPIQTFPDRRPSSDFSAIPARTVPISSQPLVQPKLTDRWLDDLHQQQTANATTSPANPQSEKDSGSSAPKGDWVDTPFGQYWVVPDGYTAQSYKGDAEQIKQSDFDDLRDTWHALQANEKGIGIYDRDDKEKIHAGFRKMVLDQFGKLLSRPVGRELVSRLVNGSQIVTIRPTSSRKKMVAKVGAGAYETETGVAGAGPGDSTVISIDDDLTDESLWVHDAIGNDIASPLFIGLGHELIHAQHAAAGRTKKSRRSEEEETISEGGYTEKLLRGEHGLPTRVGHGGHDKRNRGWRDEDD